MAGVKDSGLPTRNHRNHEPVYRELRISDRVEACHHQLGEDCELQVADEVLGRFDCVMQEAD